MSSPIRPQSPQLAYNQYLPAPTDDRLNAITQLAASFLALTSMRPVAAASPAQRPLSTPTPSVELAKIINHLNDLFREHNKAPLVVSDSLLDALEKQIALLEEDAGQFTKEAEGLLIVDQAKRALQAGRLILSESRPRGREFLNQVEQTCLELSNYNETVIESLFETLIVECKAAEEQEEAIDYCENLLHSLGHLRELCDVLARYPSYTSQFSLAKLVGKNWAHTPLVARYFLQMLEKLKKADPYNYDPDLKTCVRASTQYDSVLPLLCQPNREGGKPLIKHPLVLRDLDASHIPLLNHVIWESSDLSEEVLATLAPEIAENLRSKITSRIFNDSPPAIDGDHSKWADIEAFLEALEHRRGPQALEDASLIAFWQDLVPKNWLSQDLFNGLAKSKYIRFAAAHFTTSMWQQILENTRSDAHTASALIPYLEGIDPSIWEQTQKLKVDQKNLRTWFRFEAPDLVGKSFGLNPKQSALMHAHVRTHFYAPGVMESFLTLTASCSPEETRPAARAMTRLSPFESPRLVLALKDQSIREGGASYVPFLAAEVYKAILQDRRVSVGDKINQYRILYNKEFIKELYDLLKVEQKNNLLLELIAYQIGDGALSESPDLMDKAWALLNAQTDPRSEARLLIALQRALLPSEAEAKIAERARGYDEMRTSHMLKQIGDKTELKQIILQHIPIQAFIACHSSGISLWKTGLTCRKLSGEEAFLKDLQAIFSHLAGPENNAWEGPFISALQYFLPWKDLEDLITARFEQYNTSLASYIFREIGQHIPGHTQKPTLEDLAYRAFPFSTLMEVLSKDDFGDLTYALTERFRDLSENEQRQILADNMACLIKPTVRNIFNSRSEQMAAEALDFTPSERGYILPLAKLGQWTDMALAVMTPESVMATSRLGNLVAGQEIVDHCRAVQNTWTRQQWQAVLHEPLLLTYPDVLGKLYSHFTPSELVAPLSKKVGPIIAIHDPAVWDVLLPTDFFDKISAEELHQLLSAEVDGALTVDQHAVADRLLRLLQDSESARKNLGEAGVLTVLQHCALVNPAATLDLMAASPLLDRRGPEGFTARELCNLVISEEWVKSPKTLADRPLIVGEEYTKRNSAVQAKLRKLIAGIETEYRKKSGLRSYEDFSAVFKRYEDFMTDKRREGVLKNHTDEKLDLYYSEALHDIESVVAPLIERQDPQETITILYDIVRDVLDGMCETSFAESALQARQVLAPHNPASHLPIDGSTLFIIQTAATRALWQRALEESQRPAYAVDDKQSTHIYTALRMEAGFAIADNYPRLDPKEAYKALLAGWTRAGIMRLFREQCTTQFATKTANATLLFDWLKEQMPQALLEADSTYQAMRQQQNNFPALARHIAAHPHPTLKAAEIYALLASRPWDDALANTLGTSYKEFSAPYRAFLIKLSTKHLLSVDHQKNCHPSSARAEELRTAFAAHLYNEYFLSNDDTKAPTTLSTLALAHMLLAAGILTHPKEAIGFDNSRQ